MIQLELDLEAPPARRRNARRLPSQRRLDALTRLARALGRRLASPRRLRGLRVIFNARLRTAAGRADFRGRTIELNPRLLDRHPEELVPTLVHELCHLATGARAAHGPAWRDAVTALGFRPETCHRLDVSGLEVRRRTWIWRCVRCAEVYERRSRAAHRFVCGSCGSRLRLEDAARPRGGRLAEAP